jgi:hypothetical protein
LTQVDIPDPEENEMQENGIAWMIAGGVRAVSDEDRRQRLHRLALAESKPSRGAAFAELRQRIAAVIGGGGDQISADCCPA